METELSTEESAIEVAKLEKLEKLHSESANKSRERSNDWNTLARQQDGLRSSVRSDLNRIKAGNVWKRGLEDYNYNALLNHIQNFETFKKDILGERNLTQNEFDEASHLIYQIKLSALRTVKNLEARRRSIRKKIDEDAAKTD